MPTDFSKLYNAFADDGFLIKKRVYTASGKLGVVAEHVSVTNYGTGLKKLSYYLEGTPYERGYLLGLLAEPSVADMAVSFVDNIVFDFLGLEFLNRFPLLQKLLVALIQELSEDAWASQPRHVRDEARGLLDGCRKANPSTPVTQARIGIMNVGFDVLCALFYTGDMLRKRAPQLKPEHIRLAMMCNAFSVFGDAAGGGHYFGRDFTFATGDTLHNHLAHIIHHPQSVGGETVYPHVSVAAPGIIGSVSAMNLSGVAAGLDMSPAACCDTKHTGFNSLLLLRECIMCGDTAAKAADIIVGARRGVSWNYVLSDGGTDTACTVEAGAAWPTIDFLSYPAKELLPVLPDAQYLSMHQPVPLKNGAMVRWYNGDFPDSYLGFNDGLWQHYQKTRDPHIRLYPNALLPDGFINRTPEEKNCPSSFYFAPQRAEANVFITTNHFLLPHMRLCAMDPWCAQVTQGKVNDIQWRYDELNHQIREALQARGSIDYAMAKRLIDFLAPYGRFPKYHHKSPKSSDGKTAQIGGCVSLFDLKARTVESHYGYYADEWVKTTLPAYFNPADA